MDGSVLAAALSPSGRLLAISDDSKRLIVWTVDGLTLTPHSNRYDHPIDPMTLTLHSAMFTRDFNMI